ncbi:MAG: hypothetical protein M1818_006010 [Claussenomyces sp. TS43310]|nr:MAG: hypothetical protein M1818_006010 [Claussenomyces sp. TS43310]
MAESQAAEMAPAPAGKPAKSLSSTSVSKLNKQPSISALPQSTKLQKSQASSATNSPKPSRESSPARPQLKSAPQSRTGIGRPRKNSKDVSPTRPATTVNVSSSSAAVTPKTLAHTSTPQLPHVRSEPAIATPAPQKPSITGELKEAPKWPISPRLKSPPPLVKNLTGPRKNEQDLPSIKVQRSTPTDTRQVDGEIEESLTALGTRTRGRGVSGPNSALETVQEISHNITPAVELGLEEIPENASTQTIDQGSKLNQEIGKNSESKGTKATNESGSESGGKGEIKMRSTSTTLAAAGRTNANLPLKSYSMSAAAGRGKPSGEGSTKNMTVETETVSSIPQVAVGGGAGGPGVNGSLRAKPSTETIKPKREKKKAPRKAPSVTSGTASSKADIFEAKIASAVDEANSSDSEETFVYESNPPEISDRPRRYHSRTPSVTSMASQADGRANGRSVHGTLDGVHTVAMKKSMKFANSYNSNPPDVGAGEDDGRGTARSSMGTGRGTTHHHIGRWGRNGGNGHPSLFDNESPFPNVAKSKLGGTSSRHSSRPTSPRMSKMMNGKKGGATMSAYDIDDDAGADDERTPLIQSTRSTRFRQQPQRRPGSSLRQLEHQASRQGQSFLSRFAVCLLMTLLVLFAMSGAIGFMFATTQPLTAVKVLAIKNVLASRQELMFDMEVTARNPNVVVVTVESMDVEVFAKSKHAGTDSEWYKHPSGADFARSVTGRNNVRTRDDEAHDSPDEDDPDEASTLTLGQIVQLDSPLYFEGSPFKDVHSRAAGSMRLAKPGNTTGSPGGSDQTERWLRVLRYEFNLRVKGVLKYQLPLSQRIRSVSVDYSTLVKPSETTGPDGDEDKAVHISL